jgi:hypothetical protein
LRRRSSGATPGEDDRRGIWTSPPLQSQAEGKRHRSGPLLRRAPQRPSLVLQMHLTAARAQPIELPCLAANRAPRGGRGAPRVEVEQRAPGGGAADAVEEADVGVHRERWRGQMRSDHRGLCLSPAMAMAAPPLPLSGHGHGRAIRPSSTTMDVAPSRRRIELPPPRGSAAGRRRGGRQPSGAGEGIRHQVSARRERSAGHREGICRRAQGRGAMPGAGRVRLTVGNRPVYRGSRPYRPGPVTVPAGYQPLGLGIFEFEFQKLKIVEKIPKNTS